MPDWPTIQAAAANTNCKIIIRRPIPARETGSAYYFQLHSANRIRNQYTLVIRTDQEEPAVFHRFFAKDNHKSGYGSSRLYNSILGSNWGFFLPERNGQWYEYLTVAKSNWEFDFIWANPKSGVIHIDRLEQDQQVIWGSRIPIPPTIYDTDNELDDVNNANALEEDDIFESSQHLVDPVAANNLLTHAIAGTTSASVITETLNSIFGQSPNGSSTDSLEPPNLDIDQRLRTGPLIDISAIAPPDDTSIPLAQKQPANINSPVRPASDEWLQPPLAEPNLVTTPAERPTTLGFTECTRITNTHVASTPMEDIEEREERLAQLHQRIALQGYVAGSSQFPINTQTGEPTGHQVLDPRALSDERVRELGILDAQYYNLENAVIRNSNKQSDGRPPIIFTCNKIQSPSPDLVLTEDLLKAFNTVALEAMTKLGNLLIGAQLQAMNELAAKRTALLRNWRPNEQEKEAAKRIEASRTNKETTYKPRPIRGGRPTFRLDIQDNGPSFMPSLEPTSTSGFRPPANKNIPRPRRQQSPPRESAPYTGARPKNPNNRRQPEPPARTRYENRDNDEDQDEPRYDRYRRTRYFHSN